MLHKSVGYLGRALRPAAKLGPFLGIPGSDRVNRSVYRHCRLSVAYDAALIRGIATSDMVGNSEFLAAGAFQQGGCFFVTDDRTCFGIELEGSSDAE